MQTQTIERPPTNSVAAVPLLEFPQIYIVAAVMPRETANRSGSHRKADVFRLEIAPGEAFYAWFRGIIVVEKIKDVALIAAYRDVHWNVAAKWAAINALAEHGIEMSKYLYTSKESAHVALVKMRGEAQ